MINVWSYNKIDNLIWFTILKRAPLNVSFSISRNTYFVEGSYKV